MMQNPNINHLVQNSMGSVHLADLHYLVESIQLTIMFIMVDIDAACDVYFGSNVPILSQITVNA